MDDGSGAAPGSIVWVRRRNGSWWPAKILGPEELSHSHLTSPRAGTPVKLLGREDASVDWYNLEKSKCAKAFRCVEFSDFIEKVESSSGSQSHAMPSKKREKYASQEDAILHALQLEKQQLRKHHHVDMVANGLTVNKSSVKGFLVPPGVGGTTTHGGELPPPQVTKRLQEVASSERGDENMSCFYLQNHLKDCGEEEEGVPRMGALQSKRKNPSSVAMNGCYGKPKTNDVSVGGFLSMRNISYLNGEEMGVTCCKKRSRCMYLPEEEDDSNGCFMDDDKENHHLHSMSPSSTSGGGEGGNICLARGGYAASELAGEPLDGGGSSDYYLAESDSDSPETERDTNEEMSSLSEEEDHGSIIIMSSEEEDPGGPMGAKSPLLAQNRCSAAISTKWQLKGKRNIRNLTTTTRRRPSPCGKNLIGSSNNHHQYMHYSTVDEGGEIGVAQKWRSSHHVFHNIISDFHKKRPGGGEMDAANEEEDHLESHQFFASNPGIIAAASSSSSQGQKLWMLSNNWEEVEMNKLRGRRREMLSEVDLKVKVSYYPRERAPLVAMKSKLNGNSIIGHSIEIESIEDGSSYRVLLLLPNQQESLGESSSSSSSSIQVR